MSSEEGDSQNFGSEGERKRESEVEGSSGDSKIPKVGSFHNLGKDDEIRALIKLQAFVRGSLGRQKVSRKVGNLIEQMRTAQKADNANDDNTEGSNHDSLNSDDFGDDDSLQEYLQGHNVTGTAVNNEAGPVVRESLTVADLSIRREDDKIDDVPATRKKKMEDSWITHTPKQTSKVGNWRSAAAELMSSSRGTVMKRTQMFNSSRTLKVEDSSDGSDDVLPLVPQTPSDHISKSISISPSNRTPLQRKSIASSTPSSAGQRKSIAISTPSSAGQRKSIAISTPSSAPGRKRRSGGRRVSEAFVGKVEIFKKLEEEAKDFLSPKPPQSRSSHSGHVKKVHSIMPAQGQDTTLTPRMPAQAQDTTLTPRDIRHSFEVGTAFAVAALPKLQMHNSTDNEGIQAKIAKLGFIDKKEEEIEVKKHPEKAVDFAAQRYIYHASATKVQALARGYLFRIKDSEATSKVLEWLKQHHDIEQALTAENVTEEEREKAVMALTVHIREITSHQGSRVSNDFFDEDDSSAFDSSYDSFASDSSDYDDSDEEEDEAAEKKDDEKPSLKWHSVSDILSALNKPIDNAATPLSPRSSKTRISLRSRLLVMEQAAIKIQAVARGYLVRKSDCGAAVRALDWLKEFKLIDEMQKRKSSRIHEFSEDALLGAVTAINFIQDRLKSSATKIQALGRGYVVRKFDLRKMMGVVQWIRKVQMEIEEEETPEQDELERAWIFLEENNKWIRASKAKARRGGDSKLSPDEQYFDINKLFATWDWMQVYDKRTKTDAEDEEKTDPGVPELIKLYEWLVQNDYPYTPSVSTPDKGAAAVLAEDKNMKDMVDLWEHLEANGMNVNALREDDEGGKKKYDIFYIGEDLSNAYNEHKEEGSTIQYLDEDLSEVYKNPVPSIDSMLDYWRFSRKHGTESIEDFARSRSQRKLKVTPLEATEEEPVSETVEKAEEKFEEETPAIVAAKAEDEKTEDTMIEDEKEVEDAKPVDDDSVSVSSDEGPLPKPKPPPVKQRRTPANIDSMMTSFKWMQHKGVNLNRVRPGQRPKREEKENESDVGEKRKSRYLELEGPRLSNALNWLEQKGYDVRKKAMEKAIVAPTPAEAAAAVKVIEQKRGRSNQKGRPSTQEMDDTLKWLTLRDEEKKEKKKKKIGKPSSKSKDSKRKSKHKKKDKSSKREKKSVAVSAENMHKALAYLQKAGRAKPDQTENSGLNMTVDLMKHKLEAQRPASPTKQPRVKAKKASEKALPPDYDHALEWLTSRSDECQDAVYFKKLDNMLPGKDKQSKERRATEMTKALKWVKKQGLMGTDKEKSPVAEKQDPEPKHKEPMAAVKEKKKEKQSRSSSTGSAQRSPKSKTSKSKKAGVTLKEMMKQKKKEEKALSPKKSRTKSVASAPSLKDKLSDKMASPKKSRNKSVASAPSMKDLLSGKKSKKWKKDETTETSAEKDYELALAWLNTKDENLEDAKSFSKLDKMVPKTPNESTEERAKELVKALNWVRRTHDKKKEEEESAKESKSSSTRKKDRKGSVRRKSSLGTRSPTKESKKKLKAKQFDKDRPTLGLKDLMKVQKKAGKAEDNPTKKDKGEKINAVGDRDGSKSSPERDHENALRFIKLKEEGGDIMDCEDAEYFKKLDNMLPKKADQGAIDRASEMVKMLGWLRKKGKI